MRVCVCVCVCVRIQPTDGVNLSVADGTDSAGMKDDDGGDEDEDDDDDDAMSGGGAESPAVARGATTTSSSSSSRRRRRRRRGATVQALSALCRCLVRRHLASDGRVGGGGGGLLGAVAHLPLPPALQRFLLLDELDAVH